MSSSILYTYQHTCKKAQPAFILHNAPFKSVKKKDHITGKISMPFLGEGHYLWEENIEAAIKWGEKHYKNNYNILEYKDLQIDKDILLDFLDRRNLKYFNELRQFYIEKRPDSLKWRIGVWIEFFKMLNISEPGRFPFNYIRADENLPDTDENDNIKDKMYFVEGLNYYTFLSPLLILCIIDKKVINCKEKKINK